MGDFTVSSVLKGFCQNVLIKPWWEVRKAAFVGALVCAGIVGYHYPRLTDTSKLAGLKQGYEFDSSAVPERETARFTAREMFKGATRDIIVKEKSSGLETVVGLPDTDEEIINAQDSPEGLELTVKSDKDAVFPGYGLRRDVYVLRESNNWEFERQSFHNPFPISWGRWALGIFGVAYGSLALLLGMAYVRTSRVDKKRLKEGKRPYDIKSLVHPSLVLVFGTKEAKNSLKTTELCPSAPLLYAGLEERGDLSNPSPQTQESMLNVLAALGDDFPFDIIPGYTMAGMGREYKKSAKKIESMTDDPFWLDMYRSLWAALHYRFQESATFIEGLKKKHPRNRFLHLYAAEFYSNAARLHNERGVEQKLLSGLAKDLDVETSLSRQREHIVALADLCGLRHAQFNHVEGYKNEVFFTDLPELSDLVVFKRGGDSILKEYDILRKLNRVNRYGTLPFPIAHIAPGQDTTPFGSISNGRHLAVVRRLPGKPVVEIDPSRWEGLLGAQLAEFQSRSEGLATLPVYSCKDSVNEKIAPRFRESLGYDLPSGFLDEVMTLQKCPQGVIHSDFTGANVFVTSHKMFGRTLPFLDVESVARAPVSEDLGCFFAHFQTPAMDMERVAAEYASNHPSLRKQQQAYKDWLWISTCHRWTRQVSTALAWVKKGKMDANEFKVRAQQYAERRENFMSASMFDSVRDKYPSLARVTESVQQRLVGV